MMESQPTRPEGIIIGNIIKLTTQSEVKEDPFPELRTIHWSADDPATNNKYSIVITPDILLQTSYHVAQTLAHEMGGFLLGNRYRCPNTGREYIIIDQYVKAEFTEATRTSLTFTHKTWGRLNDQLAYKYYGKELVGWYHSHPHMNLFLSNRDLRIHKECFVEPWKVALVLEPEKHWGGFFIWDNGNIDPNRYANFYELLEDGQVRETVVAWKNYKGLDLKTGMKPPLSASNTLTPSATAMISPAAPYSLGRHNTVLNWVQGRAWLGTTALALVVLLTTLGAVYLITRPTKLLTASNVPGLLEKVFGGEGIVYHPGPVPQPTSTPKSETDEERRKAKEAKMKEEQERKAKERALQLEQARKKQEIAWRARQTQIAANKAAQLAQQKAKDKAQQEDNLSENNARKREGLESSLRNLSNEIDDLLGKMRNLESKGETSGRDYTKLQKALEKKNKARARISDDLNKMGTSN